MIPVSGLVRRNFLEPDFGETPRRVGREAPIQSHSSYRITSGLPANQAYSERRAVVMQFDPSVFKIDQTVEPATDTISKCYLVS